MPGCNGSREAVWPSGLSGCSLARSLADVVSLLVLSLDLSIIENMTNRVAAKTARSIASYNASVRAQHAAFIKEILAMRPNWDVRALEAIGKSYGSASEPGLHDILATLKSAADLDRKFEIRLAV